MKSPEKAEYSFENIVFSEASISINAFDNKGDITFDIEPKGFVNRADGVFQLHLAVKISGSENSFNIEIHAIGNFKFQNGIPEKILQNMFLVNSAAIMFPYIRAYISTFSSLSGITSIILPTMNLISIKDELQNNIEEVSGTEDEPPVQTE